MSKLREKLKAIIAIEIILTMTLYYFIFIGKTAVSYALDVVKTNHTNVEFFAYFLNENGEKVDQVKESIDKKAYLYVDIAVKNEGYLNGEIHLGDGNFNITSNKLSDEITEISGNTVKLNQINAGSTSTIKLEIEAKKENNINKAAIDGKTKVILGGQYVNSKNVEKEKYIDINGESDVTVEWKSNDDTKSELDGKVLTNSIYNVDGENKRLVQLLVSSNIKNNSYPIKNTKIVLDVPEKVEDVKVIARETKGTNSKIEFGEENYSYNKNTHKLEINLANENEEEISWEKSAKDTLVVTYILASNETLDEDVDIENKITLYDDKEINGAQKVHIKEDIDGVISNTIETSEEEIYKGKIYSGEERTYTEINKVNVDYIEQTEKIEIEQKAATYVEGENEKTANILYKETRISKEEFQKIFGEEGYIIIKNSAGATIANINNNSEANEEGKIVITYPNEEKEIKIETSKPENIGTLNIENTKSIQSAGYERKEIEKLTGIKEITTVNQKVAERVITLKETESTANVTVDISKLSTVADKQELTINATLEANDESKDLYKNPTVTFKLPKEITVKEAQYAALYKNGLEVGNASSYKNSNGEAEVSLKLNGEQVKYDAAGGTKIYLKLEVAVNKLTPSKVSQIEMKYSNENKNIEKTTTAEISFESQYGVMIYNQIANYNDNGDNIVTVDKETAYGELSANSDEKEINLNTALINNYGETVTDVTLIGKIPAGDNEESYSTKLNKIVTNMDKAKVYYSNKENPEKNDDSWGEYKANAVSYKVVVDELDKEEMVQLNVPITIPEGIRYNKKGSFESNVSAVYEGKVETNTSNIMLMTTAVATSSENETPVVSETKSGLETKITTYVGNSSLSEDDTVYEGQTVRYKLEITNNSGKDYSNVSVSAVQKNGYVWDNVEYELKNEHYGTTSTKHIYEQTENSEIKLGKIDSLKNGETYTYEYEAITYKLDNENLDGNKTFGTFKFTTEDNSLNEEIETIKNQIKEAELEVRILNVQENELGFVSGEGIKSCVEIENITDSDLNDISLTLLFSNNLTPSITIPNLYSNVITYEGKEEKNGMVYANIKISSIQANQKVDISIAPYTEYSLGDEKKTNIWILAEAETSSKNKYMSNKFAKEVIDISKDFKISQQIFDENGKELDSENDNLKLEEKAQFITTIKNNEKDSQNVQIMYYLDQLINIEKAIFKNGEETEDITSQLTSNDFKKYSVEIKAGEEIKIEAWGEILGNDSITNDVKVIETESGRISNKKITIKVVNKDDTNPDNPDPDNPDPDNPDPDNPDPDNPDPDNPDPDNPDPDNPDPDNPDPDNPNPDTPSEDEKKYSLSGKIWVDENKNGKMDSEERQKPDIEVIAIDAETGKTKEKTKTNSSGEYKFELPKGNYIIVFKYDTNIYGITTYHQDGVNQTENSDAILGDIVVDGDTIKAGITDKIELNQDISNIDLGLIIKNTFNLGIKKYISKLTISNNNETTVYEQKDNTTLAKAEIKAKNLANSLVVIEYKIKVTNNGDVDGYARSIVDYMPKTLSFNSSLNSDWYISGNNLYNTSLANTKIEPGETKELTLILTKQMTETNTGLVNNKASIQETSNNLGIENESKEQGSADVIISVSTGALVNYVLATIISLTVLIGLALIVNRKYLTQKI